MNTPTSPSPRYPYGLRPPVYPQAARIAAAPTASSHHWPVSHTRIVPSTAARPKALNAAAFTEPGLAVPDAVSRIGPTRSTSVPRMPSE